MSLARLRGANALLLALVGAALLARALIPAGWMPVGTAHGLTIELCSGRTPGGDTQQIGAAQALLDAAMAGTAGRADHKGKSDASEQPCAFAGLTQAAAPPAATPALPAPVADAPEVPSFALVAAIGRGLTAPPPPATGPPLQA